MTAFAEGDGEPDEDEPVSAVDGGLQERARVDRMVVIKGILRQHPFCPACSKPEPKDAPLAELGDQGGGEVTVADLSTARPCMLPLRLVATMEAGLVSWATIRDTETGGVGLFGLEEFVRPGVPLVSIERGRVYLRNSGMLEVLELGVELPLPLKKPLPKMKTGSELPRQADAIRCDSEHACTISREFVDSLFGNPVKLMGQARVAPAMRDGDMRGFEFRGVKNDSLPQALGIVSGDIVTSVNGNDLQSIDQVMGLVAKLRRASNLSITLERKGVVVTKEFEIR
jgi:general secretion pathway protein C